MHLAPYLYPFSLEALHIGKFCQIADRVQFITASANHRYDGFSSYPFGIFGRGLAGSPAMPDAEPDTCIGNDVWIGQGAWILPGAVISNGVIIGAGLSWLAPCPTMRWSRETLRWCGGYGLMRRRLRCLTGSHGGAGRLT